MAANETSMNPKLEKYLTPLSVVLGALVVAGAIYWGGDGTQVAQGPTKADEKAAAEALEAVAPVSSSDHIRGNPNADVFIVEYADTECPFCKRYHETLKQVMDKYGADGKVAWVYRHFPLDSLHKKARAEAVALECANEQGGNDAFWKYADRLYEITPSNDGLEASELPKIAKTVGLDATAFVSCQTSGRYDAHIEAEAQNAMATGGQGTPWTIIIGKDGEKYPVSGALPYSAITEKIETAIYN